ncbi:hypothetical protein [Candidatus Amarobacter glycogenicus]|uniref:hypothetical protein n=1 Tax=Candidatus Amarobacter glycogenicus TaxID=3140699 RepID=UPI0031CCB332
MGLRAGGRADRTECGERGERSQLLFAFFAAGAQRHVPFDDLAGLGRHALDVRLLKDGIQLATVLTAVFEHHEGSNRFFDGLLQTVEHHVSVVLGDTHDVCDLTAIEPLAQVQVEQ